MSKSEIDPVRIKKNKKKKECNTISKFSKRSSRNE